MRLCELRCGPLGPALLHLHLLHLLHLLYLLYLLPAQAHMLLVVLLLLVLVVVLLLLVVVLLPCSPSCCLCCGCRCLAFLVLLLLVAAPHVLTPMFLLKGKLCSETQVLVSPALSFQAKGIALKIVRSCFAALLAA